MGKNNNEIALEKNVIINNKSIKFIRWKKSAKKHFKDSTQEFLRYIVSTLDGSDGIPEFNL